MQVLPSTHFKTISGLMSVLCNGSKKPGYFLPPTSEQMRDRPSQELFVQMYKKWLESEKAGGWCIFTILSKKEFMILYKYYTLGTAYSYPTEYLIKREYASKFINTWVTPEPFMGEYSLQKFPDFYIEDNSQEATKLLLSLGFTPKPTYISILPDDSLKTIFKMGDESHRFYNEFRHIMSLVCKRFLRVCFVKHRQLNSQVKFRK